MKQKDLAHSHRAELICGHLLEERRRLPREQDVDSVHEEVEHGACGHAVENPIGIGRGAATDSVRFNRNKSKPWPQL
jgi:hypothetical protein